MPCQVWLVPHLRLPQHGQQSNAQAACTAVSQPWTVSKFFNAHLTEHSLFLCDIALSHNLPEVWIEPAAGNGKCERETIETHMHIIAAGLGETDLAPVITPDLTKRLWVHVFLGTISMTSLMESISFSWWCKIALPPELRSSTLMPLPWLATVTP